MGKSNRWKWLVGVVTAIIGASAVGVLAAADVRIDGVDQADAVVWYAHWKQQCAKNVCPDSARVTWRGANGAVLAVHTVRDTADTYRESSAWVTNGSSATAQVSATVVTFAGADSSEPRTASRTLTKAVVVVPPPDTAPKALPVDSLRVDTLSSGAPVDTVVTPPAQGNSLTPNLPVGLTLRGDTKFESLASTSAVGLSLGNGGGPDGRFITYNDAPFSSTAYETVYPGNDRGNGIGGMRIMGAGGKRYKRLYESIRVCIPASYVVHTNGEKFVYMYTTVGKGDLAPSIVNWEIGDAGSATASTFSLAAFANLNTGKFEDWLHPNGPGRMRKGACQRVELLWEMNTPKQSNGILRIWIDGVVSHAYTNVWYNDGVGAGFDDVRHDGTRGGGASSVPTPAGGQVREYTRMIWYASQ